MTTRPVYWMLIATTPRIIKQATTAQTQTQKGKGN